MSRPAITVIGPTPSRILFKLSKEGFNMIKHPIAEAGKAIQKRAKVMATPFKISGDYRRSIRRKTRAMKKEGEISATVGVSKSSPAWLYGRKVEHKHHIFTRLEHEFRDQVTTDVKKGIKDGMRNLKIRK